MVACSSNRTNVAVEFRVFLDLQEEMVEMEEMEQKVIVAKQELKEKKVQVAKLGHKDRDLWE